MDITESGFQTPASKKERPRDHLLSHLLVNPSRRPLVSKTALHSLSRVLIQNSTQQSKS